jgi:hypothetical protein
VCVMCGFHFSTNLKNVTCSSGERRREREEGREEGGERETEREREREREIEREKEREWAKGKGLNRVRVRKSVGW